MFKNFNFSTFSKYFGIILIFAFCAMSIFFSFVARDLDTRSNLYKTISYASYAENRFYDYRMLKSIDYENKNDQVVLVALDDQTLENIGYYPFARTVWGDFVKKMYHFGAKVVSFDVFFAEKSMSCGTESPDNDFRQAIDFFESKPGNTLMLAYTLAEKYEDPMEEVPGELYNFILDSRQPPEVNLKQWYVSRTNFPHEMFASTADSLGFITMKEDSDGVFRHYPIVANIDGLYMPSLALKSYMLLTGENPPLEIQNDGSAVLKIQDRDLYINHNGETKIRWFGAENSFKVHSLWDVLQAKNDDEKMKKAFDNKIVFVGSTATGVHDLRNTPLDAKLPGVYAHLNITNMLLKHYFYKDLNDSIYISIIILFLGVLVAVLIQLLDNAFLDLFALIATSVAALYIDNIYFMPKGYELKLFFCLNGFIFTYAWNTFLNFRAANQDKKRIKGTFSRYVAPSIVDDMLDNPEKLKIGGDKKDITCLFSDVRDFTSISESLSPTELSQVLNRYMGEMTDLVFETKGTLDKYIGDAIVAYWGAPLDLEGHPDYAVGAAVQMMEALPSINEEFKAQGFPEFKVGIGLNSGECSVGNMGSDTIFSYTALGDNMNLGARLESLCKFYGAQILISDQTKERLTLDFQYRLIDNAKVKGKDIPVGVYEVFYKGHPLYDQFDDVKLFNEAYQAFHDGHFAKSKELFLKFMEKYPEDPSSVRVLDKVENYLKNPPTDDQFNITVMTSK